MNDFEQHVTKVLNEYKRKSEADYLILVPIYDDNHRLLAYLRPITADYPDTIPNCVALLSKWREQNPTISSSEFKITHERTSKWIDKYLIENDNRIVFMIIDIPGNYLGHIGLASFDYEKHAAEIDSVLRGAKGVIPGLMQYAMRSIISWSKNELGFRHFTLKTSGDVPKLAAFYKRCGFKADYMIPLVRLDLPDETKWVPSDDPQMQGAQKYDLHMTYIGE